LQVRESIWSSETKVLIGLLSVEGFQIVTFAFGSALCMLKEFLGRLGACPLCSSVYILLLLLSDLNATLVLSQKFLQLGLFTSWIIFKHKSLGEIVISFEVRIRWAHGWFKVQTFLHNLISTKRLPKLSVQVYISPLQNFISDILFGQLLVLYGSIQLIDSFEIPNWLWLLSR
jgi:hypothetical protein